MFTPLIFMGNLTDDASIEIWGCRAGEGEYPVAKDVADASGVPVTAPDTYINFDKNGKPFFRWYRNGQWNTFKLRMLRGDEGEDYRHPYYWAPFVVFGDGM